MHLSPRFTTLYIFFLYARTLIPVQYWTIDIQPCDVSMCTDVGTALTKLTDMKTALMYCRYSSDKTHRHEDCVDVL